MRATVKKWGNSAAVRIPASVLEASRLRLDDAVEVREERGRVVIEPLKVRTYKLEDLVKCITTKNLHDPVDFGEPQGNEIW